MHVNIDPDAPVYAISIAAQVTGMHPQTLRQYDRLGLVTPSRAHGRNRLYSRRDIERLVRITTLARQGLPLHAIALVLDLEDEVHRLREQLQRSTPTTAIVRWTAPGPNETPATGT